ncbi:SPL family radical SAM protein [Effusibacillus pohliae]|uniref:SPL family radical SAM protein n=1 Tax=Effusibacillus pohliae TaxID=232270 RepID=UPI00035E50BF|nr:radical SAM protein [Effusibacillus pohliae]
MQIRIVTKTANTILTPTGGFLAGYTHSLNPYAGCAYACSYCYVRQLPIALFHGQEWGTWVDIKQNAAQLLEKELKKAKRKGPVKIFMSSSTDPYQPIEHKARVTRSLLEVMAAEPPDLLFVQTRSPLVVRDIDLFRQMRDRIMVSVTVETDLEPVRQAFTPQAPGIRARLTALRKLKQAGIPSQVAVAPVLPCSPAFAKRLREVTDRVCLDDFYMGDGSGGKRTEKLNTRRIYHGIGLQAWYEKDAWRQVLGWLQQEFASEQIRISQAGFLP